MSGSMMSSRTRSGRQLRAASKACSPSRAIITSWPAPFSRNSSEMMILGSSSTISIRAAAAHGSGAIAWLRLSLRDARPGDCRNRHGEREGRACSGPACYPQPAAKMNDDLPADGQSQPAAFGFLRQRVAHLAEFLENDLLIRRADTDAVIGHVYPQMRAL